MDSSKDVFVIGAGPAGLAATYSLRHKNIPVKCFETDRVVGGISRTVAYKGYRFDIGGHRFFTKIQAVNDLWREILGDDFLKRPRISRIYYNGKFFYYPLQAMNAFFGLGPLGAIRVFSSYLKARIQPHPNEITFEHWVSNRFGAELYNTFFKTYTEKVWGIPCSEIQAEWAAQRIKGLSLYSAIMNALFKPKRVIKTLIDEFEYPRLGPGQMYEAMAEKAARNGATFCMEHKINEIHHVDERIKGVTWVNKDQSHFEPATHFISTMPITSLISSLSPEPPCDVINAARSLKYRSLLTVNLLIDQPEFLPDTWIYVHDPAVRMGRIQCFANWSPYMVPNENSSSRGLEYFCWEGGQLWSRSDDDLIELGKQELSKLGLVDPQNIIDGFVIRMAKCYPVYDSDYKKHLSVIKDYLSRFRNLYLCGRYGLFKYNNMDHSIVTALMAAENVLGAQHDVWSVNADDDYQEELSN
ncbi:MAG: NAD(P)/FAD-dependent oxidoreductase [Desulfobacteraceae bacterium]|nr:MAG: NAD(P)/FAD-dependent oxidoreductase [Desulfobacteraceae bacterium]